EVVARNGRGTPTETPFTVDLGGDAATVGAIDRFMPVLADLRAPDGGANLTMRIRAERYSPGNGDPRALGIQIDTVRIEPLTMSWWAGARGGWPWALRMLLLAVVIALAVPSVWSGAVGGGVVALVALAAFAVPETRAVTLPLLTPAVGTVAVAGAAHRWAGVIPLAGAALRQRGTAYSRSLWHSLNDARLFRAVITVIVVAYAVVTIAVIRHVDFIGHADYADNAVRARNIVRGHGDVIDYIPQFYARLPQIVHPAETWPPLQVWMIAAAFRLFGISTVVAKLPNVLVMVGLLALTGWVGAWRWSRRVGLLAAIFLATMPLFFEDTLFPVNDLVFTLLFAAFIVALYRAWCEPRSAVPAGRAGQFRVWLPDLAVGGSAGLLLLAKPSGAFLIGGAAGAAFLVARRASRTPGWRSAAVAVGAALCCYAPWAIRNLATFGAPFHSTESYDAWVLKYNPAQPVEGIYGVFWGRPLPHPRVLIGYGYDHFLAVQGQQFSRLWGDLTNGALVPRLLLPFIVLGLIVGATRRPGFGTILLCGALPYALFVLLYWHYEIRYFLVFVPWLLLYAAAGIDWACDALATWFTGIGRRALVPLLAVALLAAVSIPNVRDMRARAETQTSGNAMVELANWLQANTAPDAVVMTRNPWEIAWHSERRAVMLPLGSIDDVYAVMRQYGVTVLALDHINDQSTIRQSLLPLYSFKEMPGITRRYDPGNNAYLVFSVSPPPA
ncbi:MAG: ArnT family glycosyltransferase, partial [Thermomicrobiales bacterium]